MLHVVAGDIALDIAVAATSFALLIGLWFGYPLLSRRRHGYGGTDKGA